MSPIQIRRLEEADVAAFRSIRLRALQTAPEAFGSVLAREAARPLEAFAERIATSAVFGAFDNGRLVGMVGLKQEDGPKDAHKAFLWGFFVETHARGRGAGASLLSAALGYARAHVEQVTLSVVARCAPAQALYKRVGFIEYGREPRALKTSDGYDDEIFMALLFETDE